MMIPKRRLLTLIFACLCFKKSLLIKIIIIIIIIIMIIIIHRLILFLLDALLIPNAVVVSGSITILIHSLL